MELKRKEQKQQQNRKQNQNQTIKVKQEKKAQWIDFIVFVLLLAFVTAFTFILFHRQTLGSPDSYHSDMKAYILEMQGLDSGYSFPYPVFFKLSALIHLFAGPELAVAIATTILNSLSMVLMKLLMNHLTLSKLQEAFPKAKYLAGIFVSVVTICLFFVSMLYPPTGIYLPGIKYKYLGVFTGNPFHNATYMAARPFAIMAFFWYAKLLPIYERGYRKGSSFRFALSTDEKQEGVALQDYILFSLFLLLATMTKPSFTIVLVGAAGLIMVWRMVKSKFRNFVPTLQLGLCFVPTFIDLLYQYKGVFVPSEGEEGGVGFTFGRIWTEYCDNIPLAICLAVGFPLLVLVLNYKELKKNTLYRFSWQLYVMGFLMAFFLYEKGFREMDFNFSWGYMYGIFFGFVGALVVLIQATCAKKRPVLLALQWMAFLWHVACGAYYFWFFFRGWMYY